MRSIPQLSRVLGKIPVPINAPNIYKHCVIGHLSVNGRYFTSRSHNSPIKEKNAPLNPSNDIVCMWDQKKAHEWIETSLANLVIEPTTIAILKKKIRRGNTLLTLSARSLEEWGIFGDLADEIYNVIQSELQTAQQMHHFITLQVPKTAGIVLKRADPQNPQQNEILHHPRLCYAPSFKRFQLENSLKEAYDSFSERLTLRIKMIIKTDPRCNPITATHSSPGGGKSFFLDELADLKEDDINHLCHDPKMQKILKESIAITISYNGDTSASAPKARILNEKPDLALCLRILYSFYFQKTGMTQDDFDSFCARMKPFWNALNSNPNRVIQCIFYALEQWNIPGKRNILLCVDELMKLGEDSAEKTLAIIGQLLNTDHDDVKHYLNACVTTLNQRIPAMIETASGRTIHWVRLPVPNLEQSLSLFPKEDRTPALEQCISDCNGHFRSLETLATLWESEPSKVSYKILLYSLAKKVKKTGMIDPDVIVTALRGEKVKLTDRHPKTHEMYDDLIARGALLTPQNADYDKDQRFVPKVSPLILAMYAQENHHNKDPLALIIYDLLGLEPDNADFSATSYELFHAHWEALARWLWRDQTLSLHQFYRSQQGKQQQSPLFKLSYTNDGGDGSSSSFKPSPPREKAPFQPTVDHMQHNILTCPRNHEGFDVVTVEKSLQGERFAVAMECKYSYPDTKGHTSVGAAEIQEKWNHTKTFFSQYEELQDNFYLVFCAWRKSVAVPENLERVIVLNKEKLTELYTKSLSTRPQFLLRAESIAVDDNSTTKK